MPSLTHYETLGLLPSATKADIKQAFRKLALKNHPDRVAESDRVKAASTFERIQGAYVVLVDTDARESYDKELLLEELRKKREDTNKISDPKPPPGGAPSEKRAAQDTWSPASNYLSRMPTPVKSKSRFRQELGREKKQRETARSAKYTSYAIHDDSSSEDEPYSAATEYIKWVSTNSSRNGPPPSQTPEPIKRPDTGPFFRKTISSAPTNNKTNRSTENIPLSRPRSSDFTSGTKGKIRRLFGERTPPQSPGPPLALRTRTNSSPGPSPYTRSYIHRTTGSPRLPKAHSRRGSGESGGYDVASESKDKARSGSQDSIRAPSAGVNYFGSREGSTREGSVREKTGRDRERLRKMELYARRMLRMLKSLKRTTERYRDLIPKDNAVDEDEKRKDLDEEFEGIVEDIDDIHDALTKVGAV